MNRKAGYHWEGFCLALLGISGFQCGLGRGHTCWTGFWWSVKIAKIRIIMSQNDPLKLVHVIVSSRLVYCSPIVLSASRWSKMRWPESYQEWTTQIVFLQKWLLSTGCPLNSEHTSKSWPTRPLKGQAPSYLEKLIAPYQLNTLLHSVLVYLWIPESVVKLVAEPWAIRPVCCGTSNLSRYWRLTPPLKMDLKTFLFRKQILNCAATGRGCWSTEAVSSPMWRAQRSGSRFLYVPEASHGFCTNKAEFELFDIRQMSSLRDSWRY